MKIHVGGIYDVVHKGVNKFTGRVTFLADDHFEMQLLGVEQAEYLRPGDTGSFELALCEFKGVPRV